MLVTFLISFPLFSFFCAAPARGFSLIPALYWVGSLWMFVLDLLSLSLKADST